MVDIKDFEKIGKDAKEIDIKEIDVKSRGKETKFEEIKIKKDVENGFGVVGKFKKFWNFLKEDSWPSFIVTLIIAFVLIKFVFFPLLSLVTGSVMPLVIVESCSMYHTTNLEDVLGNNIYSDYGIDFGEAEKWNFQNGMNKGDIIFVVSSKNIKIGDVIIFNSGGATAHPIIHRVISINDDGTYTTKGDHNSGILSIEKNISQEQIVGKSLFRIPLLGWVKLLFFEAGRPASERGFCE